MKSPYGDIKIRRNGVFCQSEDQKRCIRVLMPIANRAKSVDENSLRCWRMMSDEKTTRGSIVRSRQPAIEWAKLSLRKLRTLFRQTREGPMDRGQFK